MRALRVRACAKINWTLEVLGKRPDGYHEVRTIMQTVDLADTITLREADDISLSITGDSAALASDPVEDNLAYRAALMLRGNSTRGAQIVLEKHIPVAAGLGGGSSDGAAVLRGLRVLWALDISDEELASKAAELGSDVPFFLHGGTAIASGRGELIEPLPEASGQQIVLAWPDVQRPENKTVRMYAALRREQYSDGSHAARLADRLGRREPVRDADLLNAFEHVLSDIHAGGTALLEEARRLGTAHLCGSGPAMFFLPASQEEAGTIVRGLASLGLQWVVTKTTASGDSLMIEELS